MEEPAIGRAYYRNLRQQEQVVEDPLLSEYIQNLGEKLSSKVQDGDFDFNYFFVPQTSINAFALPGGYIGANIGLCLNSDNESQFASVLSHEISHVTQRHISRQVGDQVPNTIQGGLVLWEQYFLVRYLGVVKFWKQERCWPLQSCNKVRLTLLEKWKLKQMQWV